MMERIAEASPRFKARMAGVFYLVEASTSVFGQIFLLGRLVVHGDAAATANNILAHQTLFRLGFAAAIMSVAFHIARVLLFYDLFKPVNRSLSLLAAFVILVGCAILAVAGLFYLAPLLVLRARSSMSAFTPEQSQALAYVFLGLNAQAFNIYLVFFGFYCALIGCLIFRSTFLPRIIGVLMAFAGLGYLTLLYAPLANFLYPFNLAMAGPGEISLLLWLLVVGVNAERWKEQASAAEERQ